MIFIWKSSEKFSQLQLKKNHNFGLIWLRKMVLSINGPCNLKRISSTENSFAVINYQFTILLLDHFSQIQSKTHITQELKHGKKHSIPLYQLEFSNTYQILKENLLNILQIENQAKQVFENIPQIFKYTRFLILLKVIAGYLQLILYILDHLKHYYLKLFEDLLI